MPSQDIQKKKSWLRNRTTLFVMALVMATGLTHGGETPTVTLSLPERSDSSPESANLVTKMESTSSTRLREQLLAGEIFAGNVPSRSRTLAPVSWSGVTANDAGTLVAHNVTIYVTCDYLAVGSEAKSLRVPLTPETAQVIANRVNCLLPTSLMVDKIYDAAPTKLAPHPFSPDVFDISAISTWQLSSTAIDNQLRHLSVPSGILAGHKKDLVITRRLTGKYTSPRVAIYGWHQLTNKPIQPLSLVHTSSYLDYSHGIRLVSDRMELDGETTSVKSILLHPEYGSLLSSEGPLTTATISY